MGKEIRNYEFKVNNAQVFFNEKGEVKYKGNKSGKKVLKQLEPLFEAIAKADGSSFSHAKRVDSQKEKDLMEKLHQLLMADGVVDNDELALGDEFKNSKLTAEEFINKKISEVNPNLQTTLPTEENIDTKVEVEQVQTEQVVSEEKTPTEEKPAPEEKQPARPDSRVSANAYNETIQNQKLKITNKRAELENAYTYEQPVTKGCTLTGIAIEALKREGVEHPTPKQINERIAEIALINNISNINNVRVGTTLKVGRSQVPNAGASESTATLNSSADGASSIPAIVEPSSITVADKTVEETLQESKYTAAEKSVAAEGEEEGFPYKEWTKEGSATMFTTEIDGATLTAPTLEKLKQLRADYNTEKAKIKAKPEGKEADEVKIARQTQNIESMKKLIELSGGDINVIKAMISKLSDENYVDIKSDEAQAFVQELIKTKNVEVLTALLTKEDGENKVFSPNLLGNNKTSAETLVSLHKEIRVKENAGEKLTDKEILLKYFLRNTVNDNNAPALYTIEADEKKGIVAKEMFFCNYFEESYYSTPVEGLDYITAFDPDNLDKFAKEFAAADTDDKKTVLFAKYANTEDKVFASNLAFYADNLKASKDDVLALVAKNDMFILKNLNYTPVETVTDSDLEGYTKTDKTDGKGDATFSYAEYTKTEGEVTTTVYVAEVNDTKIKAASLEALKVAVAEYKEFNNTVAERVVTLYTEAAGDPANIQYLEKAFAKIDATDKSEEEKQKLKDKILETYFEVTTTTEGESATKHYTFKPTRRLTYEECNELFNHTKYDMEKAVLDSIHSVDDLGPNEYTNLFETYSYVTTADLKEKYSQLFDEIEFDLENDLEGAKAKVLKFIDAVGPNIDLIPFDKIKEKFTDVDFVKEHLGSFLDEDNDVNRKLTSLDIDVTKNGDTYTATFKINAWFDNDDACITLTGNTEAEVREKAEKYIRIQNISYEQFQFARFTNAEKKRNLDELKELFNTDDIDLKKAISYVAVHKNRVYDEELIDNMIETEEPGIANLTYGRATEEQINELIELVIKGGKDGKLKANTDAGAELVDHIIYRATQEQLLKLYKEGNLGKTLKIKVLNKLDGESGINYGVAIKKLSPLNADQMKLVDDAKMGNVRLIKNGDALYNIVRDYMFQNFKTNENIFPRLKKSAEEDPNKWTDARIKEALNDYWKDFKDELCADLGIDDASKIQAGQIIDLGAIKWSEHQPGWLNYNMLY